MANPFEGVDPSQIDISDPETRAYVEQYADLSDPETLRAFGGTPVSSDPLGDVTDSSVDTSDPLVRKLGVAAASEAPNHAAEYKPKDFTLGGAYDYAREKGGGYGIDDKAQEMLGPLGTALDYAVTPFQAIGYGAEALAQGADRLATDSGLADTLSWEGNKFLPGSAAMALGEAFPTGLDTVMTAVPRKGPSRLAPEIEAGLEQLYEAGTREEILDYVNRNNIQIDEAALDPFLEGRNKDSDTSVRYEDRLQQEAEAFQKREQEVAPLEVEANAFKASDEPTPDTLWPTEEQKAAREVEMEKSLLAEAEAFKAGKEPTPEEVFAPQPRDVAADAKLIEDARIQVAELTQGWKNAPEFDVIKSVNDIDDPELRAQFADDAIGAVLPDGRVVFNLENIDSPETMKAAVFHEMLGHHGLTQKFGDELDNVLQNIYDSSPEFKSQVDDWMKKNPDAYADDFNPVARAADEVFAEMSEGMTNPLRLDVINKMKNAIKDMLRKAGIDIKFSDRELRTILAMAHDATVNGRRGDVTGNGFRFAVKAPDLVDDVVRDVAEFWDIRNLERAMREKDFQADVRMELAKKGLDQNLIKEHPLFREDRRNSPRFSRREKILEATEKLSDTKKGETKSVRPFEETEPDYWRFRHVSQDGKPITGTYHLEEGVLQDFSINSEGGASSIGPRAIRQIGRDLLKQHPEARRIEGYRISGARPQEAYAASGSKFMRRKNVMGSGSEGPLQGPAAGETKTDSAPLNKFRSSRNVEEIMAEAAPEKTKESWEEWIDDAGKIKMTGNAASDLAAGTEVPELLAAKEFALKSANRIHDLSKKVATGRATERETYLLGKEQERLASVTQSIADVVSNAARILNSSKIEVATDKALMDSIRRMAQKHDMSTAEGARAAALEMVKDQKKAKRIEGSLNVLGNVLNFTRAIWSSFDLSAPFRQGRALAHRKEFWTNMPDMFKYWGNEKFYDDTMKSITERPSYPRMKKSGLAFTELGNDLSKREEQFMSTWAEKIPGVKQSERAYNGYLNKVRADVFDRMVKQLEEGGLDFRADPKALKDVASFVNTATGRGDLGRFNQASPLLAGVLFSPRLMASRINMLNPHYYMKLSPPVRKQAIKSLLAFGGTSALVASLAAAGGLDVEADPRSSDFLKIKDGNTRFDANGGIAQYLTLGARLATGQKKNARGDIVELGKEFGSDDAIDVLKNFIRSKLSPNASLVVDARVGKNVVGEKFDASDEVIKRFVPLFMQDAKELYDKEGSKGLMMSIPAFFGVSTQNYAPDLDPNDPGKAFEAPDSFKLEGEKIELDEGEQEKWKEVQSAYLEEITAEVIATEEWKISTEDEKIEIIKEIRKEARKAAKEDFFTSLESQEGEVDEEE